MIDKVIKFDNYQMQLIKISDLDRYYKYGFETCDDEVNHYTGTLIQYSKEQIQSYVEKIVVDDTRYDFLISCGEEVIGEIVLNDINNNKGHYRIAIFDKKNFSKGIGFKATLKLLEFAFDELGLDVVSLEVFPFNERGIKLYEKLGFSIEEKIVDDEAEDPYREIIIMSVNKSNFKGVE